MHYGEFLFETPIAEVKYAQESIADGVKNLEKVYAINKDPDLQKNIEGIKESYGIE